MFKIVDTEEGIMVQCGAPEFHLPNFAGVGAWIRSQAEVGADELRAGPIRCWQDQSELGLVLLIVLFLEMGDSFSSRRNLRQLETDFGQYVDVVRVR